MQPLADLFLPYRRTAIRLRQLFNLRINPNSRHDAPTPDRDERDFFSFDCSVERGRANAQDSGGLPHGVGPSRREGYASRRLTAFEIDRFLQVQLLSIEARSSTARR